MTKVLDNFVFHKGRELGSGAYSTVYDGLDLENNQHVAVKVYKTDDDASEDSFQRTVRMYLDIRSQPDKQVNMWTRQISCNNRLLHDELEKTVSMGEFKHARNLVENIDMNEFFVNLIDYSRTPEGEPGKDEASGLKFLILERGSHNLLKSIQERGQESPFSAEELKALSWALLCSTWALHTSGFVHMDIKPENIVRFSDKEGEGQWKLIDLDDIKAAGGAVEFNECVYTPYYMPPELAGAKLAHGKKKVTTSRLMDVWSVGMVLMEAIFLQPVLKPWFQEWAQETGSDDKYFAWLRDFRTDPIISGDMEQFLRELDPALCDLLKGMLRKDPNDRFCISRCLVHDCFQPMRKSFSSQASTQMQESTEEQKRYQGDLDEETKTSAIVPHKRTDDAVPSKTTSLAWSPSRACVVM